LLGRLPPPAAHSDRWWDATATPTPAPETSPSPTPPAENRCSITVLEAEPAEPFDLIGIVEAKGRGPAETGDSALEAAKIQACSLGGDALVILFRSEKRRSGFERIQPAVGALPDAAVRAAVIRYRGR
jgi:hypothetical protein